MNSYSQAGQDRFVYEILGQKKDGNFLDVGCHDGHKHSNSLGLEELGWRGVLVDICYYAGLENRKSPHVIMDAVNIDWMALFDVEFNGQSEIDYLSLDVDDRTTATLRKLLELPMRYRVITIEHDLYRLGMRAAALPQRDLLAHKGYDLMCRDVHVGPGEWGAGGPFEDWWVCHELMTEQNRRRFCSFNELGTNIVPDES